MVLPSRSQSGSILSTMVRRVAYSNGGLRALPGTGGQRTGIAGLEAKNNLVGYLKQVDRRERTIDFFFDFPYSEISLDARSEYFSRPVIFNSEQFKALYLFEE